MKITEATPFDDAFGRGAPLELSVRAFNILKREGINTVGEFLKVTNEDLDSYRHMTAHFIIEVHTTQRRVQEILDYDIADVLIEFLLREGLAEESDGYGHASAAKVATALLEEFYIVERDE